MLQSCSCIGIIYVLLGEKIQTTEYLPTSLSEPKDEGLFHSFGNFRHFAAKIIPDSIQLCTYSFAEAQIHS